MLYVWDNISSFWHTWDNGVSDCLQALSLERQGTRRLVQSSASLLDRLLPDQALPETLPWQLMGVNSAHALQLALLPFQVRREIHLPSCPANSASLCEELSDTADCLP